MGSTRILTCTFGLALLWALLAAPGALASFHLIQVREVYPGTLLAPEAEYVELQMYGAGENHVAGHKLRTYNAAGAVVGTSTFATDVPNGANQSTIVLATPQAAAQFGVAADLALAAPGSISPAGGAVCWEGFDCVSWGNFSGPLPSAAGTPAPTIPDGMALRRTIARDCATALDPADDSNDSAADLAVVPPAPRPNSVPPSEQPCPGTGSGGGPGTGPVQTSVPPQTILRRKPPKRTADRTASFRFSADESGVRYQCKLDGKPFRGCHSPFTTKRLALGPHTFRVRAVDAAGTTDPTPASYRFKIVRGG